MKRLFSNISLLFVAQLLSYAVPLLEIPILAGSLQVDEYGKIVLIQSMALLLSLFAEYGFTLNASRQAALLGDSPSELGRLFGSVLSAKLIIVLTMTLLMLALGMGLGVEEYSLMHILCGYVYFLAFALSPFWIFQGRERMTVVVLIELVLRFLGLGSLYLLVTSPGDDIVALMVMAGFAGANTLVGNVLALHSLTDIRLDVREGFAQLRSGFHSFVYKSSGTIFSSAGPAVVGLTSGHAAVALYAPAEKIVKGVVSLATPLLIGLYPFITKRYASSSSTSFGLAWLIIGIIFVGAASTSLVLYEVGGWLIQRLLGPAYDPAQALLSIFVFIIPFRMVTQAIGLMILMPVGKDRIASALMLGFAVASLMAGALAGALSGLEALVISFIVVEGLLCIAFIAVAIAVQREFRGIQ